MAWLFNLPTISVKAKNKNLPIKTGFYSETWLLYQQIRGLTKHNNTKIVVFGSKSKREYEI